MLFANSGYVLQGEAMYNKVYIEITNICNMNCSFCHGHKRPLRKMSKEEFALILDKLSNQTKYIYYHLMGEPLTHPLLPEFIQLANQHGFKSIITTNGTLLNKRKAELLHVGIHKINISLHSFEEDTGEEHSRYVRELAEFSKAAAEQGTIIVFRLWNKGYDGGKNDIVFNILKETIPGEWSENTRGVRIRNKIHLEWGERFEWPDQDAEVKGEKFSCYGLRDHFGILSDGTVVPCCLDSDGVIALGNVFRDDLSSILSSDRASAITKGFKCGQAAEDLCRRCGYAQRFV